MKLSELMNRLTPLMEEPLNLPVFFYVDAEDATLSADDVKIDVTTIYKVTDRRWGHEFYARRELRHSSDVVYEPMTVVLIEL